MNIIVAGIIGRYPWGGVTWCSLMYLLGLQRLGHRVWYLEDTGECNFDPVANTVAMEPDYALNYIQQSLSAYGLGASWCYVDYRGRYFGHEKEAWLKVCRDADLFLDLSGGCWFWREEYARIPHSGFIDTDPAFTQLSIARGEPWYRDFFTRFGAIFTFGRNIGTPACDVPTGGLTWHPTWQPVLLDEWEPTGVAGRDFFTTVMTWKILSFEEIGGNKDQEFLKVLDLPSQTKVPLELAVNGPQGFLREHGWTCVDAFGASADLNVYRDYVRNSRGEFSVAKHTYVNTNSGWFSDRTECYLAAGRPAVVQDTGFSAHLPTGKGLMTYRTKGEAIAALEEVQGNYEMHCRAAREVAAGHFSAEGILRKLVETCVASRTKDAPGNGSTATTGGAA